MGNNLAFFKLSRGFKGVAHLDFKAQSLRLFLPERHNFLFFCSSLGVSEYSNCSPSPTSGTSVISSPQKGQSTFPSSFLITAVSLSHFGHLTVLMAKSNHPLFKTCRQTFANKKASQKILSHVKVLNICGIFFDKPAAGAQPRLP